jgi:hypothetical protein
MMSPDELEQDWLNSIEPEWLEFYLMTPEQRWARSAELRAQYLAMGGTLEPDPDPQSPFWSEEEIAEFAKAAVPRNVKMIRRGL